MNTNIPNNTNQTSTSQVNPPQPQPVQQQVVAQPTPVQPIQSQQTNIPTQVPQPQPQAQVPQQNINTTPPVKEKKQKSHILLILFLLIIIGGMGYYIYTDYQKDIKTKCSPLVPTNNKTIELDKDSTIVQDLYSKVKTNIKEDIANNGTNEEMMLYLAYRQIPKQKIYESNCNLFNNNIMSSVKCQKGGEFIPNAFKEEDLQLEVKKLFGEETVLENNNIRLGNSCIGVYQYIKERGEYVQGSCSNDNSTIYKVDKTLLSATVTNDTITLKEKVRYYGSESLNIDRLKNGVYIYKFKLDNNYNYIYIGKTIEQN